MIEVDRLDYKILDALQTNNQTPLREIGDAIGLSAPAVQRRVKRLRDIGMIQADVAILNPDLLGSSITLVVQVELEADKIQMIEEMKELFMNTPEVQHCFYVTGEVDFVLVVTVRTMKAYELLTHRLFFNNPAVLRFNTFVSMDRVKQSTRIPLD